MKRITAWILAVLLIMCSAGYGDGTGDTSGWLDDRYSGYYERLFHTGLYIKIPSPWEAVYTHDQPYWKDPHTQNDLTAWLEPQDFYILINDYDVYPYTESVDITLQEKRSWHIFTDHKDGYYTMDALTPSKEGGTLILEIRMRDDTTDGWTAARRLVSSVTSFEERNGDGSITPSSPTPVPAPAPTATPKPTSVNVGDYMIFGHYEQDNNASNGKEPIEWIVLEKDGNKALLISRYALDCQQYNTKYTSITWENCTLRKWLNGTFLESAFSAQEQAMIQLSKVTAGKNPSYGTPPGNDTTDWVFLLSIEEAQKYFNSNSARQCKWTAYCYAQGAYVEYGSCWWWLRSPGSIANYASSVDNDGSLLTYGSYVNVDTAAIRPVMWINLES